ncbi:MAG: hypothetical protein ACK5CE_00520, partial [Actinomycetes bacterium]
TPTISQTVDSTRVALVGGPPRTQVVRHVEQLEAHERDDVDTLLVVFTMLSTRTITAPDLSGEYGRISNRTIQNLLDIDVYRARDLLRDLRDRGLLVKTSAQERGIAVEYGPGGKFPHPKRQRRTRDSQSPTGETLFDPTDGEQTL